MLSERLFPQLKGKWGKVNLTELAIQAQIDAPANGKHDERLVEMVHRKLGVDYSYGGYLEDRGLLMKRRYQKPGHAWHLGVDYNVPLHTDVYLPITAHLIHAEMDQDQDGGWGGKLIFSTPKHKGTGFTYTNGFLVFGHLDQIVTERRDYLQGERIGRIADSDINGDWFPHLHVQCMWIFDEKADGYSHWYKGIEQDYPDPEEWL